MFMFHGQAAQASASLRETFSLTSFLAMISNLVLCIRQLCGSPVLYDHSDVIISCVLACGTGSCSKPLIYPIHM